MGKRFATIESRKQFVFEIYPWLLLFVVVSFILWMNIIASNAITQAGDKTFWGYGVAIGYLSVEVICFLICGVLWWIHTGEKTTVENHVCNVRCRTGMNIECPEIKWIYPVDKDN